MIWWAVGSLGIGLFNAREYVSGAGGIFNGTVAVLCMTLAFLLCVIAMEENGRPR